MCPDPEIMGYVFVEAQRHGVLTTNDTGGAAKLLFLDGTAKDVDLQICNKIVATSEEDITFFSE